MSEALLLDTHVLLWAAAEPGRLTGRIRRRLQAEATRVLLSRASIWELAVKSSLGKLRLLPDVRSFVDRAVADLAIEILPIENEHLYRVADLPFHHRDPFDRLLVAQALCEDLTLASRDRAFDDYGVRRVF